MNAVVILAHGCPVGSLGPYGNEWIATPNLDRLAAEAVVYDRHIADDPEPGRAGRSWWVPEFVSAFPQRMLLSACRSPIPGESLWTAAHAVGADWPADIPRAAGELRELERWLLVIEHDEFLPPWTCSQDLFDVYMEDWLEDSEEDEAFEPWLDPPLGPMDRELATWELLHRTHAAVTTAADARLGRALAEFRRLGWDRSAAWVFTSGRGFALGEHGEIGPLAPSLHAEVVHLPLIMRWPGAVRAGERIAQLTQPGDLFTLLQGRNAGREHAISRWGDCVSVRTAESTLIRHGSEPARLYEYPKDRGEVLDLSSQREAEMDRLTAIISSVE